MKKHIRANWIRRTAYAFAFIAVIAVNGHAVADPFMAKMAHFNQHRQENAERYGTWDVYEHENPVRSIHAALLRTGKVLLIAGSGNDEKQFDQKSFRTILWDPKKDTFTEIPTPWDAFCAGHAFLPDGRLLVAGGTQKYEDLTKVPKQEYEGVKDSYLFDPQTERYEKVDTMDYARWYPTLVGLPDGKVLASSGLDETGEIIYGDTEVYDPATKEWTHRPDLNRYFPTYPSLILAADGRLFYTGSNSGYGSATAGRTPGLWNLGDNTFQPVLGIDDESMLETSASLLLPPAQDQRYMVLGGGGIGDSPKASNKTHIVDLTDPAPRYQAGPNLGLPTRYLSAVILPDDTVFTTGGSRGYRQDDNFASAIYHPDTNSFSKAATPIVGRNYHSAAILLPDGRVATFGSNSIDNSFEMRIEIYSPAYMHQGNRPRIVKMPTAIAQGTSVAIQTSNPRKVATAKLLRPSAVTHTTDVEQRSINLSFTPTADGITIDIPANRNVLPAGWYMAVITDTNDIPSEAYWVQVK